MTAPGHDATPEHDATAATAATAAASAASAADSAAVSDITATEFDVMTPAGRLHAQAWGADDAPLAICVHGLSANMHGFDVIGPRLAARGRRVVAVDLRGRGRSDITGPQTYGFASHTADVLAVADGLGAATFDWVGWSMGAMIGILTAAAHSDRIRRLVLIDAAGGMDGGAREAVGRGLMRLDAVVDEPGQYLDAMREAGAATPWGSFWERYFSYELAQRDDGRWTPRTSREACLADLEGFDVQSLRTAWQALAMPVLLVRCTVPLGGGLLVPDDELAALRAAIPHLDVSEVALNHYGVMGDDGVAAAVAAFVAR